MKLIFVETSKFSKKLDSLKGSDFIKSDYESVLLENPKSGDVIQGTGGLRKLRLKSQGKGKSGGYRLLYLYIVLDEKIYLLGIYDKSEKIDLNSDEKKQLKKLIDVLKAKKEGN